jgi:hypothetical protein
MQKLISTLLFCSICISLTACSGSISVGYQPPLLPIKISINTNGELQVSWDNSIQTPYGTFSAKVSSNLAELYPDKKGVLIVNVDGVNSVYNLDGRTDINITLESGYYKQVELRKEGLNWYFGAARISVSDPPIILPIIPIDTPTSQAAPVQPISSFTQDDINRLIGSGNWHCIDGFPKSISIDDMPSDFVVQFPFTRIDRQDRFYYQGEVVTGNGYATGWLENNLPNNTCSSERPMLTQMSINELIGVGNWYCLEDFPTGVKVRNVPSGFTVQPPAIMVDKNNIRYYEGQGVPSGGAATVWFANSVPSSECP